MKSIKIYLLILLALLTVGLGIYITFYHSTIINDRYEQVTIIKNGGIIDTIQDLDRINNIIEQINSQPRDFYYNNSGLKYDYLPHGRMIFENDKNQKVLTLVYKKNDQVNVISDYWEVQTHFNFEKEK